MLVGCSTDETIYNEIPVNVVSTDTSPFNRKLSLITPSHKSFNNSAKKTLNNITKILRDKASTQKNKGDIHIYDGYIKYLEYENFHTYTFLVADSNYKNKTKNVILRSNTDGSYSAFLTTYSISNEEILAFHNGENINFKNKVSIIPITLNQIQSRASNCFKPVEITSPGTGWTDLAWKEVPCSSSDGGGYGGGTGSNDPYDNDNSQDDPYGNDGYNNSGYDNSGYDNDSYNNSNSGGGSSGFENSSENFSVGQPIDGASNPFFIEDLIISLNAHLEPNLNDEQIDWLRESPENIDFGVNALEALENGGDVNFENRIIKDPSFIGTQIDCVLNSLTQNDNNIWRRVSEAFTPNDSEYRIRFTTYNDPDDTANARTGLPGNDNIINIRFNLGNISSGSLEIATDILHETFHAELHRIHLTDNAPPNSLPQEQFDWFEQLWIFYSQSNNTDNGTASDSEHFFISQYLINPIAMGLQEFDSFSQPLNNYEFPAWSGLNDFGLSANYINHSELNELANLYTNVLNDNNEPPCN